MEIFCLFTYKACHITFWTWGWDWGCRWLPYAAPSQRWDLAPVEHTNIFPMFCLPMAQLSGFKASRGGSTALCWGQASHRAITSKPSWSLWQSVMSRKVWAGFVTRCVREESQQVVWLSKLHIQLLLQLFFFKLWICFCLTHVSSVLSFLIIFLTYRHRGCMENNFRASVKLLLYSFYFCCLPLPLMKSFSHLLSDEPMWTRDLQ